MWNGGTMQKDNSGAGLFQQDGVSFVPHLMRNDITMEKDNSGAGLLQ
jgi:hypothetical protein